MIATVLLLSLLISSNPLDSMDQAKSCADLGSYVDSISNSNLDSISLKKLSPEQVGKIGKCPALAVNVIPKLWNEVGTDSAYLDNLMLASATIKDARIENTLKQKLFDSTGEYWVRVAAFQSLLAYERLCSKSCWAHKGASGKSGKDTSCSNGAGAEGDMVYRYLERRSPKDRSDGWRGAVKVGF